MADRPGSRLTEAERAELKRALEQQSTRPFTDLLTLFLEGQPTAEEIREFARKNPAHYMQGVTQAASLSGYKAKVSVEHTGLFGLFLEAQNMSDSELETEYQKRFAPKPAKVIDITPQSGAPAQDDTPPASPRAAHP